VLRALSLCTCCRQYPGAAAGRLLRSFIPAVSAFPEMAVGSACTSTFSRLARRSLALRSAHARSSPSRDTPNRRLRTFCYLHARSDCFRLERCRRAGLAPAGKRRLVTAHAKPVPPPICHCEIGARPHWRPRQRRPSCCIPSVRRLRIADDKVPHKDRPRPAVARAFLPRRGVRHR